VNLTNEDVQAILRLLDASPYDELHLETDRFKLTLRRSEGPQGGWTQENTTRRAGTQVTERLAAKAEHLPLAAVPSRLATDSSQDTNAENSSESSAPKPASRDQHPTSMHAHTAQAPLDQPNWAAASSEPAAPEPVSRDRGPPNMRAHAAQPVPNQASSVAAPAIFEVRPPLIGTFYRAPKPGAAPFVEVGAHVDENTVVGIVETMKLMNSIYAGARGEVLEICAQDGELVQPDRVLMRLRTAGS
jgi:acetyl-CoA carboxylase biotin carboxyl carrier protein